MVCFVNVNGHQIFVHCMVTMVTIDLHVLFIRFLDTLDNPIQESPTDHSSSFLTVPPTSPVNDHTPSSSPCRDRNASFSNPLPSIQLEIDGLYRKVRNFLNFKLSPLNLTNRLMIC